jgi:putative membrane protein
MTFDANAFLNSIVYAVLGIVILVGGFWMLDRMTPHDLWNQIVQEKNVALAILIGAMSLAMGVIIAASVH